MAGHKETPRQKMIGMMYLVLLALLAMNVSKEVLNAFVVINNAMEKTNETFAGKNEAAYNDFVKQNQENPAKVGKYLARAKKVKDASETLDTYIEELKKELIAETAGLKELESIPDSLYDLNNVEAKDNYDAPTHILIGSDESNPKDGQWSAAELRQKIEEFKSVVAAQVPTKDKADFDPGFKFEDVKMPEGKPESWAIGNFYHVPLAAVITNLTVYQSDVKNVEAEALKLLYNEIDAADFKFDKIEVKVIPKSNYVVLGDSFKADVIVAAYSTTENPLLEVGTDIDTAGSKSDWKVINPVDEGRVSVVGGVAHYGYKPTSEGEVNWAGFIKMKEPGTGKIKMYPFRHTFIAAKPALVVSPTKMNVFYKGLDNPLEVSVSGFSSNKITVSASGGSISGSNGKYIVKPGASSREVKVRVSVKMDDGSVKSMGEKLFRVKRVPDPLPKFAGVTGSGKVSLTQLKASSKVTVELKDFLFDGLKFQVTGFEMVGYVSGKPVTFPSRSDNITSAMKNMIKNQRKGGMVTIKNIKVIKPGGVRGVIPSNVIVEIK